MSHSQKTRVSGFTMVELLVVLLIIAVLASILLPVIWKANRRASILTCQLVYVDDNGGLRLSDSNGGKEIQLATPGDGLDATIEGFGTNQLSWSPSGTKIGFTSRDQQGNKRIAILEPATGVLKQYPATAGFKGWLDSTHALVCDPNVTTRMLVVNTDSGNLEGFITLPFESSFGNIFIAHTPLTCRRGRYACMSSHGNNTAATGIVLLKKDFSLGKVIWDESPPNKVSHWHPRVDPLGEWVAWTIRQSNRNYIAFKSINAPASDPPSIIGDGYPNAIFCDWTEDSKILANVMTPPVSQADRGGPRLVVLNISGLLIREIQKNPHTSVNPTSAATIRKYEHW